MAKVGGARIGAGRKKGSLGVDNKSREIRNALIAEGSTPLQVMIKAMRAHEIRGDLDKAATVAKDAAPYMHPRLASVEHAGPGGGAIRHENVTNEDRARALLSLLASVKSKSK